MRLKIITKADIILAVVLLVLGLGSPFLLAKKEANQVASITMDGESLGRYSLDENIVLLITSSGAKEIKETALAAILEKEDEHILYQGEEVLNIVEIKDGYAKVVFATCQGNDCVKMGDIDSQGEVIACLPHKLLVTVEAKENGEGPDVVL